MGRLGEIPVQRRDSEGSRSRRKRNAKVLIALAKQAKPLVKFLAPHAMKATKSLISSVSPDTTAGKIIAFAQKGKKLICADTETQAQQEAPDIVSPQSLDPSYRPEGDPGVQGDPKVQSDAQLSTQVSMPVSTAVSVPLETPTKAQPCIPQCPGTSLQDLGEEILGTIARKLLYKVFPSLDPSQKDQPEDPDPQEDKKQCSASEDYKNLEKKIDKLLHIQTDMLLYLHNACVEICDLLKSPLSIAGTPP